MNVGMLLAFVCFKVCVFIFMDYCDYDCDCDCNYNC